MIDAPISSKIKHRVGKKAPKLGGLRDIAHLDGCLLRRKEAIRAKRKPFQPSGDKHYMVRRKKKRELYATPGPSRDKKAFRAWKYDYFKIHGARPDVTYMEWWIAVRGSLFDDPRIKGTTPLALMPYDYSDHSINNMYVSFVTYGNTPTRVFLADAALLQAEWALQSLGT